MRAPPEEPTPETLRRHALLQELPYWGLGGLAVLLLWMNWPPLLQGWIIAGVMFLLSAIGIAYRRRHAVPLPRPAVDPLAGLTPAQQVGRLQQARVALLGISTISSVFLWAALASEPPPDPRNAPIPAILKFVYAFFGPLPTILIPIGFGVLTTLWTTWRIHRIKTSVTPVEFGRPKA